jgi:hypothetical protein
LFRGPVCLVPDETEKTECVLETPKFLLPSRKEEAMKSKRLFPVVFVSVFAFAFVVGRAPEVMAYNKRTIKAKKITFSFSGSEAIPLKDHTRPDSNEDVPTPEYIRRKRNEPAAYPQGSTLSIKVMFKAKKGVESAWIGSSLFERQLVTFTKRKAKNVTFTATAPLDLDVGVHTLKIDWYFCDVNGLGDVPCANPQPMRKTKHTLYITHGSPAGTPPFFKKVVEWSCQWSELATTEEEIVQDCFDGIWGLSPEYRYVYPFSGRTGDKVDDILDQKEGACSEWAMFLLRCVEAQGVDVYTTNIVPDKIGGTSYDRFRVERMALGDNPGPWVYSNHVFVIYGGDFAQADDPSIGTAYDPTYHLTGPGWGGYEDVLINYLGIGWTWFENPGFGGGPGDDVLNTKLYEAIDDWDY